MLNRFKNRVKKEEEMEISGRQPPQNQKYQFKYQKTMKMGLLQQNDNTPEAKRDQQKMNLMMSDGVTHRQLVLRVHCFHHQYRPQHQRYHYEQASTAHQGPCRRRSSRETRH